MKKIVLITLVSLYSLSAYALEKKTFLYSTKGEQSLYLDLYQVDNSKGCVIYAFAGGFMMGERDEERFEPYFQFLNDQGYSVVSIDYRLGFKNIKKESVVTQLIPIVKNTITMAVEDLFSATLFILEHSTEWGIDKSKIIISGSSAGAITVVQAEYEISNCTNLAKMLPEDFNYAGVMSYAGAVCTIGNMPKWQRPPCPMLFFHGDADTFVPFNSVSLLSINMCGANYIVKQIKELNTPYYFYIPENVDHLMASAPLSQYHNEIAFFLHEYIEKGRRMQITYKIEDLELPEKKDNYTLIDIINTLIDFVK